MGASFDSPEKNAQFKTNQEFPFELLSDTERELALHFGAATSSDQMWAARITVLLDSDGSWLLAYDVGNTGLRAHAGRVLEDIQAIFGP